MNWGLALPEIVLASLDGELAPKPEVLSSSPPLVKGHAVSEVARDNPRS